MKDVNNREIRVGDVVLYAYGFWSEPQIGVVTKIYKNGFKFLYHNKHCSDYNRESIAKKPSYSIIMNNLATTSEFKELFDLSPVISDLRCSNINTDMLDLIKETKEKPSENLEDI